MSHFTKVSTEIRDLEACEEALNNMGLQLSHNEECRYYYGTKTKENVVKLPGKYDMALESNGDGTYNIVADFYGKDVENTIGAGGKIFLQNYAVEMLKKQARKMHMTVAPLEKDELSFRLRDSQNNTGGYMIATINPDGTIEFKPVGLKGTNCKSFMSLEDALGAVKERQFTPEYYQRGAVREKEKVGY